MPRGCREALDVGCGDGLLVRRLAPRAAHVTGLNRSAGTIAGARRLSAGIGNVEFVHAGLLESDLAGEHYDFVCSVAAIHHMDFTKALTAMRETLRPGGSLAVIGLARNATPGTGRTRRSACRCTTSTGCAAGGSRPSREPRPSIR
ncbi:MAG: class I SAM-dependent methyltransferase [Actinomadura sp.]